MGSCSASGDQVQLASLPCSAGNRLHNLDSKKDTVLKSEADFQTRARPESRPKPKDQQQIQDRIVELRKLIPNSVRMSIDSLLARTIKHMLFLASCKV
ncbi:hypothetical protein U1Q18_025907 [Sarracenia purpurea var. burkii]